jgi:hypothetical protein
MSEDDVSKGKDFIQWITEPGQQMFFDVHRLCELTMLADVQTLTMEITMISVSRAALTSPTATTRMYSWASRRGV